jgi:hypothetical protein
MFVLVYGGLYEKIKIDKCIEINAEYLKKDIINKNKYLSFW